MALAFAGVAVMSNPDAGGLNWGDVLTLLCGVVFALHVLFVDRWSRPENRTPLIWLQFVMASTLSVIAMPLETRRLEPSLYLAVALTVTALLASVFAIWGQMRYQPRLSPTAAAVIYSCEPVFAGVASWLFLGAVPSQITLVGAALIVAGMLLSAVPDTSPKPSLT